MGKSKNRWLEVFTMGGLLHNLHLGFLRSTALIEFPDFGYEGGGGRGVGPRKIFKIAVLTLGRSRNRWLEVFTTGGLLHNLHLGFLRSTAFSNFPHLSHWSPLASSYPQPASGQVPSTKRSARNLKKGKKIKFFWNFQKIPFFSGKTKFSTFIALISACVLVSAPCEWAGAFDEPIR